MTFWPCPQQSRKSIPEIPILWLSGLGPRSRQSQSQKSRFDDFLAFALRSRENQSQKSWFGEFLALAARIEKMNARSPDLISFCQWLQKSAKRNPRTRFDDCLALAPEVDADSSKGFDLMTFWFWLIRETRKESQQQKNHFGSSRLYWSQMNIFNKTNEIYPTLCDW